MPPREYGPQCNKQPSTSDWNLFGLGTECTPAPGQKEGREV